MLKIDALSIGFSHSAGLWKKKRISILKDISLQVSAGYCLAIIGASGVGKTLLADAILGLLPEGAEVTGRILLNGRDLLPFAQDMRGRLALIAQDIGHLDPMARVDELILWAADRAGKNVNVSQWLARLGLAADVGALRAAQLSGGMARRVMAIMALLAQPEVLILDEPTAGLDPESRDLLLGLLRDYVAQGGIALVISHDLIAVLPMADHVAVLQDGGLQAIERASDFSGQGESLQSDLARAYWLALPENGFGRHD